jgi:hypothetical protein
MEHVLKRAEHYEECDEQRANNPPANLNHPSLIWRAQEAGPPMLAQTMVREAHRPLAEPAGGAGKASKSGPSKPTTEDAAACLNKDCG